MNTERLMTTRRIKRIDPLQFGKVLGVLCVAIGLLVAPFFLAMALFEFAAPSGIPTVIGIAMAVFVPVFYGAIGFIQGVIGAWLYNVTVRFTGGMEIEFE